MVNDIRVAFLYTFAKGYVFRSLANRKGKCLKCGKCCKGCFLYKGNKCISYEDRPRICYKDMPIDKFDLKVYNQYAQGKCGYYWEKK